MPADRCPSCGTVGPAGSCACQAISPTEQTAVLPPLDGPHLVRPYVADTPVMESGNPAADPFATQVVPPAVQPITSQVAPPPVQPITPQAPMAQPPHMPMAQPPQAAGPFAPPPAPFPDQSDAAATQLLPPVQAQDPSAPGPFVPPGQSVPTGPGAPFQLGRVVPPPPQPEPPTALIPPVPADSDPATVLLHPVPDGPERPAADLGMFSFHEDESAAPVSRTERRSQRRRSADRKRLVIAGGAVGVTALAVSMAMLLSSSPDSVDHALPAPTGPAVASSAATTPSAPPSAEASPDASASADSPSPTRSSARPSQSVATKPATAPTTAPAEPTSAPPTGPSSSPSPSANRTLRRNDTGPDVVQLQHLLMKASCMPVNWLDGDITDKYQPGFGAQTQNALMNFQWKYRGKLKGIEPGVYDPQTQALLQEMAQNPKC
ncbi:hypothetical protein [Kitasatospora sp. NPDC059673]|uniref:peptidoglycan-binding domain-containing protein n=1 Tax=Kitasatospora sp. NPDC059673 TaxID=3346901 RepID=UPI00369BDD8A